jgi:hypothetical protein
MAFQIGTPQGQASLHSARERRASLAGSPDLFRTHRIAIPAASIAATTFPARTSPVTFKTSIRITTGASAAGLIFEFGNATTAVAAWLAAAGVLTLRAGDAGAADRTFSQFDNGGAFEDGQKLDLIFAVIPGDGRSRIWMNGLDVARDTATNGQLDNGWAASSAGAFAAAAVGALPADVTETGAPTDFDVIQPLSVYVGQVPRHFV